MDFEKYDTTIHEKYGSNVSQPEIDMKHGVKQLKILVKVVACTGLVFNENL
ncbi:Hypothetical predicted protein [Olea europaea subsp. europaea]|uniref:Uncharacterized protein n=1 Tax=Olea europaea subsp. europaea TaxID=158383 RepID=A0A8S0QGJ5_OLEEU|nr:Hypothetical predicted protein [Olea europaea subsp. europaea]